jgi:polyhydroxybutyrate depolymerase
MLVMCFHGGGSTPEIVRYESRFDEIAEKYRFRVLYPAGTSREQNLNALYWNDGRKYQDGTTSTVDDVAFVEALMGLELVSRDPQRVYAAGYSNGAQFCYYLAQRMPAIAAFGMVAGHRGPSEYGTPPGRPINLIQFAGRRDTIAPYYGGVPRLPNVPLITVLSPVRQTILGWARNGSCRWDGSIQKGKAMKEPYKAEDGTEVILWTLLDGGHTWPGGKVPPAVAGILGPVNRDIIAAEEMARFFLKHPL